MANGHDDNQECPNKQKFWVTAEHFDNQMVQRVAERAFIVVHRAQPVEILAGETFWQNPKTKQVYMYAHSLGHNKRQ